MGAGDNDPKTRSYEIPNYRKLVNDFTDPNGHGIENKDHPNHQRYTYINVNQKNKPNYVEDVKLRNIVSIPVVQQKIEMTEAAPQQQKGGLYFNHGYDKFTPADIVKADGFENADMRQIAHSLIHNPAFELKMTAHADTSGDTAKNQTLSENRLNTARDLLVTALQQEGLTAEEAKTLYEKRVAPHSKIVALGEKQGPVGTGDNVIHQGNRVVTFDLITHEPPQKKITTSFMKHADFDNHEHTVVLNVGSSSRQKELFFYPDNDDRVDPGKFAVADENTNFVIRLDPGRKEPFTVLHCAHSNLVADNTNFLIECDKPGAVTSRYNAQEGVIEVSVDGKVAAIINTLDRRIDPALIQVGQVTSDGHATISPLTNLDDVRHISEMRNAKGERSILTGTADRIVGISIEAKHLYMKHPGDPEGYKKALAEFGFEEKIDDALKQIQKSGIDTEPFKKMLVASYANPQSAFYTPDQIVFPFQTYQALYESEVSRGAIKPSNDGKAYQHLMQELSSNTPAPDATAAPTPAQKNTPAAPRNM